MRFYLGTSVLALVSVAASAGEDIRYEPAAEWVEPVELPDSDVETGKAFRSISTQVRLEDGTVSQYQRMVVRLNTPEYLTQMGTVSAQWLPDKGDLIVHEISLVRDGEVIDVLAGGAEFEVLRREQQLERRMFDGLRTATLTLPGAKVGDEVRVAYTTTRRDQTLDGEGGWTGVILAEPIPMVGGNIVVSWDEDTSVNTGFVKFDQADPAFTKVGDRKFRIALPIEKLDEMPSDAPSRYMLPPMLTVTTFADYEEISKIMAPLYATAGTVEAADGLDKEIAKIARQHKQPEARMAAAVQLVQDEISYLFNGLNGGNYNPQTPAETWDKKYGDCKAKTLLLLSILHELDIEADAALVTIETGDMLPELTPDAGNFNHVIVRAQLNGKTYWLDGTSTGTRLANLGDVARFYYALPLIESGSDLVNVPLTPYAVPLNTLDITFDQSAGIDVPALVNFEFEAAGPSAAMYRVIADQEASDAKADALSNVVQSFLGTSQNYDTTLTFDEDRGVAIVKGKAIVTSPWRQEKERQRLDLPYQPASLFGFSSDRARPDWQNIPVKVNGPYYNMLDLELLLPKGEDYRLMGTANFDEHIGGNTLKSTGTLDANRLTMQQFVRNEVWEIPASELAATKRDAAILERKLPRLIAPTDYRRMWNYGGKDRSLLRPLDEAFAKVIAEADDEDISVYEARANFRQGTGDWKGALADLNEAIEREASSELFMRRAYIRQNNEQLEQALADLQRAEELDPTGATFESQIELLTSLDRNDDAIALAEEYSLYANDPDEADRLMGVALGLTGKREDGMAMLADLTERTPNAAGYLNQICWYSGIWNVAVADTVDECERAVELASDSSAAIDSRALVLYRLGRTDDALKDLQQVLDTAPWMHASRYLRGVIRLREGIPGGQQDIDDARRAVPDIVRQYERYGLGPTA